MIILRKYDCFCRKYRKSRRRKYCACNPNSHRVSRNFGEMHFSHFYRGMVDQEEDRLNNCLERSDES
jgi:hypothetical protein